MELWDGYHRDGTLAGRDLVRGEPIPPGLYHMVCQILVRHADGEYLLMLRHPEKPHFGGWYEATAGGSAMKGEDSLTCVKRELREETGISSGSIQPLGGFVSHDTIYRSFLCVTDVDKGAIRLQEGETVGYRWVSEQDFIAFVNSDRIIDIQKLQYGDYFRKMGYSKRHPE